MQNKPKNIKSSLQSVAKNAGSTASLVAKNAGSTAIGAAKKAGQTAEQSKEAVIKAIDQNGNGEIDIEDIIVLSLRLPFVHVNREDFLRREFQKNHPENVIADAIEFTPAHAKISADEIDKIADEVIKYERNCVSGISAALGMPGGVAMAATLPTDIAQYYGYMLRAAQKLMYLYGFPEIEESEAGHTFDSETLNILTICLGVMYGVEGANTAIKAMAAALGKGVEKKLLQAALTKGTIYPIVKSISKWFGVNLTKKMFAGFFKNAIPVVGGVIGGGITFLTFKPCCDRLKASLQDTMLSNPEHHQATKEENDLSEKIQAINVESKVTN